MGKLNEAKGFSFGDSVLRWLGIVLQEESRATAYRLGWDDFAVILTDGTHSEHEELLNQLFARLNKEGEQMDIPTPPATIALIHFDDQNIFSINDVMFHLWETIHDVKLNNGRTINIYSAHTLIKSTTKPDERSLKNIDYVWEVLRYIANNAIGGIVGMGHALDATQKNALLDSISGLPNMRAALMKLEKELSSKQPFAMLLIDGDNIRRYNSLNYAAGDQLIQDMGKVISENLRPGDFVARWRTGDEFMVILPNTHSEGARVVGERFCSAIREASKAWKFPTSISIGIAAHPRHGDHVNTLVDMAEAANKQAKDEGKDRVIVARSEAAVKEPA